jgi:hypothetical protein
MTIKQQIAAITAQTASIRADREELKAELDAFPPVVPSGCRQHPVDFPGCADCAKNTENVCALCGYESPNHFILCANHPENIEDRKATAEYRRSRCGSPSIAWCNEDGCGRCSANEAAVTA